MRGEDRAFLAFETAAGAPVALLANLAVHGQPAGLVDRLTLVGTRGTLVLDGDALRCFGARPAEHLRHAACYLQSYAAAIAHFVDCLRQRRAVRDGAARQPAHARAGRSGLRRAAAPT